MIGHRRFRENDDLPLRWGPVVKKKPPFSNARKKYIRIESDNVWTGESGYFRIRWRKKSAQSLTEQYTNMAINLKARVGRTEQMSRHYLALRRMLWRHFSAVVYLAHMTGNQSEGSAYHSFFLSTNQMAELSI